MTADFVLYGALNLNFLAGHIGLVLALTLFAVTLSASFAAVVVVFLVCKVFHK